MVRRIRCLPDGQEYDAEAKTTAEITKEEDGYQDTPLSLDQEEGAAAPQTPGGCERTSQ